VPEKQEAVRTETVQEGRGAKPTKGVGTYPGFKVNCREIRWNGGVVDLEMNKMRLSGK